MTYKNASNIIISNIKSDKIEENNPLLEMTPQEYNDVEAHFLQEYGQYFDGFLIIIILDVLKRLQDEETIYEDFYKAIQKESITIKNICTIKNEKKREGKYIFE